MRLEKQSGKSQEAMLYSDDTRHYPHLLFDPGLNNTDGLKRATKLQPKHSKTANFSPNIPKPQT
jgi:hypothetical protein